jgi:hypothetical protein
MDRIAPWPPIGNGEAIEGERPIKPFVIVYQVRPHNAAPCKLHGRSV